MKVELEINVENHEKCEGENSEVKWKSHEKVIKKNLIKKLWKSSLKSDKLFSKKDGMTMSIFQKFA